MSHVHVRSFAFAAALLLSACATTPMTTPELDQARSDYVAANNTPDVARYAPQEFKQAGDALDQANAAAAKRDSLENVDKLAYLAKQKIATAREVARGKAAEAQSADAARQRDQVRLDARTAEADRARMDAANAQAKAANAQAQVADAQNQAADAKALAAQAEARNAELAAKLADLQAKQTERGMIITIGDVLFATDQARLTPAGMATVRKLADVLIAYPKRTVLVEGFTDSTGSAAHNQDLSERRANAVRVALLEMGVAADRVATRGYGAGYPVAPNDSAGNRQLNRRVEIVLSNEGATIPPR